MSLYQQPPNGREAGFKDSSGSQLPPQQHVDFGYQDPRQLNPRAQPQVRPGGFWWRVVAHLLDSFIAGMAMIILMIPLSIGMGLLMAASGQAEPGPLFKMLIFGCVVFMMFMYYAWFYVNKGATPGKMACGLRVVSEGTGKNLTYGQVFLREFIGKIASGVILWLGFLMVAFTPGKRGLHDYIGGTRVLKTR